MDLTQRFILVLNGIVRKANFKEANSINLIFNLNFFQTFMNVADNPRTNQIDSPGQLL